MNQYHIISSKPLDIVTVYNVFQNNKKLKLSDELKQKILASKTYLDNKLMSNKKPIYGINTGFGSLYNVKISNEDLTKLQENLVMSHACGTGEKVPESVVKVIACHMSWAPLKGAPACAKRCHHSSANGRLRATRFSQNSD